MNLLIQDELQLFSEELYRHLTPSLLEKLAKELGFAKRKRKFSGNELAAICIWVSQRTASDSLVIDAFLQGYKKKHPKKGLIIHTAMGSVYKQ